MNTVNMEGFLTTYKSIVSKCIESKLEKICELHAHVAYGRLTNILQVGSEQMCS